MIDIDSDSGTISIGDFVVCWGNSEDPISINGRYFEDDRLEGYTCFGFADTFLELGAIDQDRPGVYLTKYKYGDIEWTKAVLQL